MTSAPPRRTRACCGERSISALIAFRARSIEYDSSNSATANRKSVAAASVASPMSHAPTAASDMRKFMSSARFIAARTPRGTTYQPPASVESASAAKATGRGAPNQPAATPSTRNTLNRNQGVVAQMEAQARQATYEARAAELRIRAEVADALRAYRAAAEETTVLESSVLEPAQRNSELLETAFRAGKIALPTLLLLRNQLLDAQEGYWIAWLAQREALVGLEAATQSFALPDPERDDQTHTTTPVRTP